MGRTRACLGCALLTIGFIVSVGCRAPEQRTHVQQIPRITKLVERATAYPDVHRFRRPLRDERDRTLRQLGTECERMAASLQTERVSAQALTGSVPEAPETAQTDTGALETALRQLADAARRGDEQAIRSAHQAALTVYAHTK